MHTCCQVLEPCVRWRLSGSNGSDDDSECRQRYHRYYHSPHTRSSRHASEDPPTPETVPDVALRHRWLVSTQLKLAQWVLLILNFSVCAATIQRTVILPGLLKATDYTWEVPPQMIWGFVEINAGLICASVPGLKPFFVRYLPFIITSHLSSARGAPSGETGSGGFESFSNPLKKDKRKRSKMANQSYELSSNDYLPDAQDGGDEAKLWERNAPGQDANAAHSGKYKTRTNISTAG